MIAFVQLQRIRRQHVHLKMSYTNQGQWVRRCVVAPWFHLGEVPRHLSCRSVPALRLPFP